MTRTLSLTLGELLRLIRERSDLTQLQLGAAIDMGRTSVIRAEQGDSLPKWKDVVLWVNECNKTSENPVDPDELRDAWETAKSDRQSGWLYGPTLLDLIAGEVGDDATVVPLRTPAVPARRQDAA